jgi:hypothetical protein
LEYIETVHQLFLDLKKAYDSVRREVLDNIRIEFVVTMELLQVMLPSACSFIVLVITAAYCLKHKNLNIQCYNFSCGSVWERKLVSDIKGRMYTESV